LALDAASPAARSTARDRIEDLIPQARLEAMPFGSAEEQVRALPKEVVVTVTCSPKHGLDHTIEVAERWAGDGRRVVPHIAARMVRGADHLSEVLGRLQAAGISDIFLISGDAERPLGPYASSGTLLEVVSAHDAAPKRIGIAAYPEGHPQLDAEALEAALADKQRLATHMTTQICFDPAALVEWLHRMRARGIDLPVLVGVPGAVQRRKLARISLQVGVGGSMRFLTKHGGLIKGLARRRRYEPTDFMRQLAPAAQDPRLGIAGFHMFTFNEIARTLAWGEHFSVR
jgi:methylenetetrahydrofolate reductase (NADPH)